MNINKKIIKKILKEAKPLSMGVRTSHNYIKDPQRLVFSLSRYKFVAKMFEVLPMSSRLAQVMDLKVQL